MTNVHSAGAAVKRTVQLLYPLENDVTVNRGNKSSACSKHTLGRISLPRQSKTDIDWGCIPPCVTLRCRDAWTTAYATICGPEDIINGLINDVINCVGAGVAAAGISAIFAGPAAALPAFEAAFKACLTAKIGDRVNELSVSLSTEEETGDWGPC